MCVTSLLCSPRADLWLFYGFYVNGFLSIRFTKVGDSSDAARRIYREKTVYIKTHKTLINRPVDLTGET